MDDEGIYKDTDDISVWAALSPTGDASLALLLEKIERSIKTLNGVEALYVDPKCEFSRGMRATLLDWMERKQDQIDYERHRVYNIGLAIAAGRSSSDLLDI